MHAYLRLKRHNIALEMITTMIYTDVLYTGTTRRVTHIIIHLNSAKQIISYINISSLCVMCSCVFKLPERHCINIARTSLGRRVGRHDCLYNAHTSSVLSRLVYDGHTIHNTCDCELIVRRSYSITRRWVFFSVYFSATLWRVAGRCACWDDSQKFTFSNYLLIEQQYNVMATGAGNTRWPGGGATVQYANFL